MFSKIYLNRSNLIHNINTLSEIAGKPLCVMVKANAYGHGMKEIVEMLGDNVSCYGVSNQSEALSLREMIDKEIIVFGKCEDYKTCINNNISFALFSFKDLKQILREADESPKPKMHLCINSGMNRYGIREIKEYKKIIDLLRKKEIELAGIYTHFSSLTTDEKYTQRQIKVFEEFVSMLPTDWKTIRHIGGGRSIFEDFYADMFRVGIEVYGYGSKLLKPVLSVESEIINILKVKKGEHVGYLCGFTADKDMTVATIPLGYGDGLPRKLSNKLKIKIKNKLVSNVGNICMDSFMIDVSEINCKVGDKVLIVENAEKIAKLIESTEYEALTNLSKFRGERIIKN